MKPYRALHNKEANLEHLRVIGARAFVHIETNKRKLDPHAWEGRLVGYNSNSTYFKIYNPVSKRAVESRNVIFLETSAAGPQLGLEDGNFSGCLFNCGE